jgi:hypothetical protein
LHIFKTHSQIAYISSLLLFLITAFLNLFLQFDKRHNK